MIHVIQENGIVPSFLLTNLINMNFLRIAAISAAIAIALGAFGAHALNDRLVADGMLEAWKTAVLYHLVHSVALFSLAFRSGGIQSRQSTIAAWSWLAGMFLFSGSLYGLALGGPSILGPITPLGGLGLIIGWVALAFSSASE
jgi:uncharacterized membrane protein YgdD (TMEM256/DUF423 family)